MCAHFQEIKLERTISECTFLFKYSPMILDFYSSLKLLLSHASVVVADETSFQYLVTMKPVNEDRDAILFDDATAKVVDVSTTR